MDCPLGGEKLFSGRIYDEDGDGENVDIKGGDGYFIAAGVVTPMNISDNVETQFTIGWKAKGITADDGKVTFHRIPLEALIFAKQEKFRIGGGLTYHLNPELSGHGSVGAADFSFDNALGFIVEADYLVSIIQIGVRGSFITYKKDGVEIDGNGIDIVTSFRF